MNISKRIQTEKIPNLRDLGGMEGAGGKRIRNGLLFRSEQLYNASENDIALLEAFPLKKIMDFRNTKEAKEKPDPEIEGCTYLPMPIIDESTIVSWESDKFDKNSKQVEELSKNPMGGIDSMCELYRNFVKMPYSRAQYKRFLQEILETEDGAILWHCTLGKDRCGWGSVLVQAVLGVSQDVMMADYLYTNECLKDELAGMVKMLQKLAANTTLKDAGKVLMEARKEYLLAAFDEVDKEYGSFENFIRDGLGIDDSMVEKFRARFLE